MLKDIIRFYKTGKKKLVHEGVTLEQAQEWCNSPLTRKEDVYFDGYGDTGHYPMLKPIYKNYFAPSKDYH